MTPGPVSDSYLGPMDRKPEVPAWALPKKEDAMTEPSEEVLAVAEALFSGEESSDHLVLNHMDHGVLILDGRDAVQNGRSPLIREIARAIEAYAENRVREELGEPRQLSELPLDACWERAASYWKDAYDRSVRGHEAIGAAVEREVAEIKKYQDAIAKLEAECSSITDSEVRAGVKWAVEFLDAELKQE